MSRKEEMIAMIIVGVFGLFIAIPVLLLISDYSSEERNQIPIPARIEPKQPECSCRCDCGNGCEKEGIIARGDYEQR